MRCLILLPALLLGLATTGCTDFQLAASDGEFGDDEGNGGPDNGNDEDLDEEEPAWWSLDGVLVLDEEGVVLDESLLALAIWTDSSPWCEAEMVAPLAVEPAEAPDGIPLLQWWTVEHPGDEGCGVPTDFSVGIGDWDHRLEPAADRHGLPDQVAPYGLYIQLEGDDKVYVFGMAGDEAVLAGEAEPVEQAPLPPGSYQLIGLYLLPLGE